MTTLDNPRTPRLQPDEEQEYIGRLFLTAGTQRILKGPTLHEICLSIGYVDSAYRQPLRFDLEREKAASIYAYVTTLYRGELDEEHCQLGILLKSRFDRDPRKRPALADATILVPNYNLKSRSGWVQLTPYVRRLLEAGEGAVGI